MRAFTSVGLAIGSIALTVALAKAGFHLGLAAILSACLLIVISDWLELPGR